MTPEETIKILSIIKAAYPQWARDLKPTDAKAMVNLWSSMLEDYPYNIVQVAIKKIIATNKFPPSVAEVIEAINYITSGGKSEMTEIEAWGLVRKAIKNSVIGSNFMRSYKATVIRKKEEKQLPQSIRAMLGNIGQNLLEKGE